MAAMSASNSVGRTSAIDISTIMSNMDDIIEDVLKKLPMKSLQSCARVCKKWRRLVENIKKRSTHPNWILLEAEVQETMEKHLEILASEPNLALVFCSTELYEKRVFSVKSDNKTDPQSHQCSRRSSRRRRVELPEYLRSLLPPSCELAGVTASGVVGTSSDCKMVKELEWGSALSVLLMPSPPCQDIYTFHAGRDLKQFLGEILVGNPTANPDAEKLACVTNIPVGKCPKLVLLFYAEQLSDRDTDLCAAIVKHYGNVVVAGGFVDNLMVSGQEEEARGTEVILHGVAFCGEDIKVASILLPSEISDPDTAQKGISRLKAANIPKKKKVPTATLR